MDLGLTGSRVLVSGGTKGIGRAIADMFAAEGAHVALCARDAGQVAAAVAEIEQAGGRAFGKALDVADAAAMQAWVAESAASLGGIDIVVPNVSALAVAGDEAAWQAGFQTDLMGSVRMVDAAMPWLEKSAAASIVIISSVSGREIDFAAGPYGAFKAALIHYAQGLAFHLAGKNIRANTVSPGNTYFPGGVWEKIEQGNPGSVRHRHGAQPDRPHGDAAGNRPRRRVPRQPGGELHHRHQPGGGWGADAGGSVLAAGQPRLNQPIH